MKVIQITTAFQIIQWINHKEFDTFLIKKKNIVNIKCSFIQKKERERNRRLQAIQP